MTKERMTRRSLLQVSVIGAATGAMSLLVSACGGGQTAAPTTAPTTAPAAPTTAPAAPTTAAAASPTAAAAASPTTAAAAGTTPTAAATTAATTATTPTAQAAAATGGNYPASIKLGINLPFTGADAADAANIRDGALMAIDEINAQGGIGGKIKIEPLVKDDGTVAAGQYDPAQAATNMKQFVADSTVMTVVGPQMSGSGKAMSPIASQANLPLITPSSTNPDITDPKFASQYRPGGKAIYFRTVTTDAFQGPFMANYAAETLKIKSIYVVDDTGAYGEGIANSFEAQAKTKGINVLGHDKLDPKESDYTTILTKIKGLNPEAIYYGGVQQAGVKLAKQANDVFPKLPKLAGDGMYSTSFPKDAGPAAEGWYATIAGPDTVDQPEAKDWVAKYKQKYNKDPQDYAITAYDAVLVFGDTVSRIVKDGKPLTRDNVESYMLQSNVKTLQGTITFDENGDIKDKIVSIFQVKNGDYVFVGAAPQS
jgi:branched-chain amino acid transport system substrate-binding protein